MNALDTKIRRLLDDIDRATPPPPRFEDLDAGFGDQPNKDRRGRVLVGAAAVAVVALGVGGLAVLDRDAQAPADQPATETPGVDTTVPDNDPSTAPETTAPGGVAPGDGGPLFTSSLDAEQVPVVIVEGAATTYAQSQRYPSPFGGGFTGATVLVPVGASFDTPRVAIDVVERTAANGNLELDLSELGQPIAVAGTTGYLSTELSDFETGEEGPINLLFFEVDDSRYVRVNAVGIEVDEMVSIVDSYDPATGAVDVPDGFEELAMPDHDINQTVEFQYDLGGGVEADLQGSSRGAEYLLGSLGNSITSTQIIDGLEVTVRSPVEDPNRSTVFWVDGDWAFRANFTPLDDSAAIDDLLRSFRLVDDTTFASTFEGDTVVTDSTRTADVDAMLADVDLPPSLTAADLTVRRGANVRYQEIAAVSGTIACTLLDVYFDNVDTNPTAAQQAADSLAASTEWDMLLDIETQGGWSRAVWETAAAINGTGGIATGGGEQSPTRENTYPGLGCDTR